MIDATVREECCGCAACVSACPVGCVSMEAGPEGFAYPRVDVGRCVGCNKCERVCPFGDAGGEAPVEAAYAVRSRDSGLLLASSSGGVFTELSLPVLDAKGVVYGVVMDDDCRGCSFARAESAEGLSPMRGSKYLQASSEGVFGLVRRDLDGGRRVLFSGTPCQANALVRYLGGRCDGLLVVDCICHGVPSPRLWAERVGDLEASVGRRVRTVNFRCKDEGRRRFGLGSDVGGGTLFEPMAESAYLRMFLRDLCLRPSCYSCKAKMTRRSDVTIADFWGAERVVPEMTDEMGCSLVVARTPAGVEAIEQISETVEIRGVPYENAVRANPAVSESAARPPERDAFFGDLDVMGYAGVARKYGSASTKERLRGLARGVLGKVGLLGVVRRLRGGGSVNSLKYGVLYVFDAATPADER